MINIRKIFSNVGLFQGKNTNGIVPDPTIEENKFLRDDGTWASVYGSNIFGTGSTISVNINSDENNFTPTNWNEAIFVRITPNHNRIITGFESGNHGDKKIISNLSSNRTITIKHNSGSSDSDNRVLISNNKDYKLRKNGSVIVTYDGISNKWRIVDGLT